MEFGGYVPGQQTLYSLGIFQICIVCCLQQPGQILVRIQSILNRRLDQAEHNRAAGGTLWSIGKQEVLAVNHKGLNDTSVLCG